VTLHPAPARAPAALPPLTAERRAYVCAFVAQIDLALALADGQHTSTEAALRGLYRTWRDVGWTTSRDGGETTILQFLGIEGIACVFGADAVIAWKNAALDRLAVR